VTDKTEDKTKDDAKKQQNERLLSESKALTGQGFNKQQIAQQLSSKHQMTVADVTAILDQNKEDDK